MNKFNYFLIAAEKWQEVIEQKKMVLVWLNDIFSNFYIASFVFIIKNK